MFKTISTFAILAVLLIANAQQPKPKATPAAKKPATKNVRIIRLFFILTSFGLFGLEIKAINQPQHQNASADCPKCNNGCLYAYFIQILNDRVV